MIRDILKAVITAFILGAIWAALPDGFLSRLYETASARGTFGSGDTKTERGLKGLSPGVDKPAAVTFTYCGGSKLSNCVVDGDTFRYRGDKIRIADIDTPELHPSRCAHEEALGQAAKARLLALLNDGDFELQHINRDRDRYGRLLRVVVRDGRSIGDMLVSEGLARTWEGRRRSWCE